MLVIVRPQDVVVLYGACFVSWLSAERGEASVNHESFKTKSA